MTNFKRFFSLFIIISILTGCGLIENAFKYKETSKEFIEALLKQDYTKAKSYMAIDHETARQTNLDTLKKGLASFRTLVVTNFGDHLDYSFMNTEKTFSTNDKDNTPPNTTILLLQLTNQKEFGVFQLLFDDKSGKILNINLLKVKEPIPSMTLFWLFGLLAICVPVFNIYVIRQIKKSNLTKKWLKYIAVLLLNAPSISYHAVSGLSFKLIYFQFLLGFSFGYMGFLNSIWTFGIPLGGIYWLWKIKKNSKLETEVPEEKLDIVLE